MFIFGYNNFIHAGREIIETSCLSISILSAFLLIVAVLIAIANSILFLINYFANKELSMLFVAIGNHKNTPPPTVQRIRIQLGAFIAIILQLLIAVDILETLTKESHHYSFEHLGKIAAIAAFRTIIAHMLGKEMHELESNHEVDVESKETEKDHAPVSVKKVKERVKDE